MHIKAIFDNVKVISMFSLEINQLDCNNLSIKNAIPFSYLCFIWYTVKNYLKGICNKQDGFLCST